MNRNPLLFDVQKDHPIPSRYRTYQQTKPFECSVMCIWPMVITSGQIKISSNTSVLIE